MFGKQSIAHSYLTTFSLIIVLPVLMILFVLNHFYSTTLQKNANERILQAMEQIGLSMENEGKRAALLAATIANDDEILDLATDWGQLTDANLKFRVAKQIDSKLNYLFNYTNTIESVIFFMRDRGFYYYKNQPVIEESVVKQMKGYQAASQNGGRVVLICSFNSFYFSLSSHYVLSAWIKPETSSLRNNVAMIYIGLKTDVLENIYSQPESDTVGDILIVDETGKIIGAGDRSILMQDIHHLPYLKEAFTTGNHSYIAVRNRQKTFITSYVIQKTHWRIINLINYRLLTQSIERIWYYAIAVLIVLTILFFSFTLLLFREMILPVNGLIAQMKRVEDGNFDANITVKGNDEIYRLGQSFNRMVLKVKNLIEERDLKEKARGKAELEALKSQINPHFIANTLNSIGLMAMIAKVDSIKNMVDAFIKLLTASFSKDEALTTVVSECANLQSYIYIMKVMYGDKFDVQFAIDDDINDIYILKMVLQPILENAILHGVSDLEERKGQIRISGCRSEGCLRFEIRDNGVGMTPEQVTKLMTEDCRNSKGFNSIGIMNVDKRIKLYYGEQYGLTIESMVGEFTKVIIMLPVIES